MTDPTTRLNNALEGRYTIERELGEGGMATVYLAQDLKHERKVALKVLKPELAAVVGAERFLTEIKVTANLQHPHILPLFDSGEADGFVFYVMPYVEGETLRDRIDREKQLPVDEAVRIASAVANALQMAHEQGIIHRDIKPANILLSRGEPLIADFGIALAVGAAGGNRLTETGLSLGTPYYMSPEQATGDQTVGPATDTYALGCVLYEMLVGDPPYVGSTAQAVLGKIIAGKQVSATEERPSVPTNVDAAIRKALEKLPADRFTAAEGFGEALADPGFRHGEIAVAGAGPWNRLTIAMTTLAAVLTLALGWSLFGEAEPVRHTLRYTIPLPKEGESEGLYFHFHLSPDGQYVAVSGVMEQAAGIFVRALNSLEWRPLSGTSLNDFFWSPDSRSIAFFDTQKLRRISVGGGPVQDIADVDLGASYNTSGSWSRDDVIVFEPPVGGPLSVGNLLFSVPAGGGEPLALTTVEPGVRHRYPAFLPDGRHFLYTSQGGSRPGIYVASLDDPVGRLLLPDPSRAVFAPGANGAGAGHLIFARDGRLMAQPFDPSVLELRGEAFVLAERALWSDHYAVAVSVSDNGILTYLGGRNRETDSRLVWFDRSGTALAIEGSTGLPSPVSLSPDESMAAVLRRPGVPTGHGDVWLRDLDRGLEAPFTFDGAVPAAGNVVWSPDGSRIAFSSAASESLGLYIGDVTASGTGAPIFRNGNIKILTDWSRGGYLLYTESDPETGADLWYLRMDGSATGDVQPVAFRRDQFDTSYGQISPDGQWIAYVSNETGSSEVWVQAFPSGAGRWRISAAESEAGTTQQPRWSRDGSELFYVTGAGGKGTMMAARVRTPPGPGRSPVVDPQPLFEVRVNSYAPSLGTFFYDVSGDGERFLINEVAAATEPVINVVVNWEEEVRQQVPN